MRAAACALALLLATAVAHANVSSRQLAVTAGELARDPALDAIIALESGGHAACTAVLVTPRVALTAAHCIIEIPPVELFAVIGADPSSPRDHIAATAWFVHPGYDRRTQANDLALVLLSYDATVAPAQLSTASETSDMMGSAVTLVGYGHISGDGDGEHVRRIGTARVAGMSARALTVAAAPSQACAGDSGGPVLSGGAVAAIVSTGDRTCDGIATAIRIDHARGWIDSCATSEGADCAGDGATSASGCAAAPGRGNGHIPLGFALVVVVVGLYRRSRVPSSFPRGSAGEARITLGLVGRFEESSAPRRISRRAARRRR